MILTVGNTKGGVGKTTLALNIAISRAIDGHDVWLIDADRQGTAQTAIDIRSSLNVKPLIACAQYVDGSKLRSQVTLQKNKFKDIIIDVGGRDSTALRAAIIMSDILLIPFHPRSFDVWALNDISSLVDEANSMRDGLKVYAVLSCADTNSSKDNIEARNAVSHIPQLQYLDSPIYRRKSYANAAGQGLSVLELTPKDLKACNELNALIKVLFQD